MRTLRVYILDDYADALRAAPRSVRGLARDTRGAVRAPRLLARNRAALPQAGRRPPREAKGCADGAMVLSQDEIDGMAPASSALAAVSSVKNGAALCQTGRSPFRTERAR